MTHYGAKNLADSFRTVRNNTIAIAEEIPTEKYAFKATADVMSVAEMLAHIACAYRWHIEVFQKRITLLDAARFGLWRQHATEAEKALVAGGRDAILRALKDNGDELARFMESLDERALADTISFAPPIQPASKGRFEMLLGIKEHEMHHRGQLMLIQRLIGQVPPLTRRRQQFQAAAQRS
jgi:uncharacterized damage-inducible protein DinB